MSCGSRKNKNCYAKSCQRYYNNNAQVLDAGETLQLVIAGNRVVDSGISIETQPQNFITVKTGLYRISGDVVISPTAAGDVTLAVYMDGVQLPCTLRTITLGTGTREVHTETDLELDGCCCDVEHSFAFVLISPGAGAGTVIESCYAMLKLA